MSLIATRGLPFDHYAYPVNGIPSFKQIGPEVEPSVVYSIARQESAFNLAVVSPAQAYGLMQVTPDATSANGPASASTSTG
jgi:soluble lytic murein transglycosylase